MREAVRFIATRSTGSDATLAARLGRRLVAMRRQVARVWRGHTAARCPAEPNGVRHPAFQCLAEEITGASLQDRWSTAADRGC
jgi:hypothetical protein